MIKDFTLDDLDLAVRLGIEEWGKYNDLSQEEIFAIADSAVRYFFERTTYAKVYEVDGEAVGLILGAVDGDEVLFPNVERTPFSELPEEAVSELALEAKTDDELLEECKDKGYDSEVVYFIASGKMRGKGIGTKLIDSYLEYLKSKGKKRVFLYTDDFSKYQYYEKKGFVRDAAKTIFIDNGYHEYYIYSKML